LLKHARAVAGAAAVGMLSTGCTSGQLGVEPPTQVTNVAATTVLEFTVGTANFSGQGVYLNTVVTYRQPNGLSAVLLDTPQIQGPAGFAVPAGAAPAGNVDDGKSIISGTPQVQPGTAATPSTFGTGGGAFSYGFAPVNSVTSGVPLYPGNTSGRAFASALGNIYDIYPEPMYAAAATRFPFLLGPPATPEIHNGTFPPGFAGYSSGFTAFATTPVAGTYTLTVTVPGNSPAAPPIAVKTAAATLATLGGLPAEALPAVTELASGGASFAVAAPPGGVTHQILYVVDANGTSGALTFYSIDASAGGTYQLTTAQGPVLPNGQRSAPFATGDTVAAYVVGADYDILGLAPPGNTQQSPALPAQADITVSAPSMITY
jgi:hypothetical protein